MLRRIITPTVRNHTFTLPKKFYGKRIKVIAYEVENEDNQPVNTTDGAEKIEEARAFFNSIRVDMTDFKFDRDEANER